MSRVMRTTAARHAVFGLALGLATTLITSANAGDFYPPDYRPYATPTYQRTLERERYYAPPAYRRAEVVDGICRTFQERRVDPYGRETLHRIRMCEEGPVYAAPNGAVAPDYEYKARKYYEQSGYYAPPRPPAALGYDY